MNLTQGLLCIFTVIALAHLPLTSSIFRGRGSLKAPHGCSARGFGAVGQMSQAPTTIMGTGNGSRNRWSRVAPIDRAGDERARGSRPPR